MALVPPHQGRMDRQRQPQTYDVDLCAGRYSNRCGRPHLNPWSAVLLVALAAGAHQGWSANIYTLTSDMFPRSAVASVVGFATMVGAISGMLVAKFVGYILQRTGSYVPVFLVAGSAYLVAFA